MLRNTPCQPVVGLDLIVENRNDNNDIVEYECSICSVFLHQKMIFWHVISFPHKEQFFVCFFVFYIFFKIHLFIFRKANIRLNLSS